MRRLNVVQNIPQVHHTLRLFNGFGAVDPLKKWGGLGRPIATKTEGLASRIHPVATPSLPWVMPQSCGEELR